MRNRNIERLICVFVAVTFLTGLLTAVFVSAKNTRKDPNIALLDAMLDGKRQWVIETLVEDDRSHNPYAITYSNASKSLMATAFSQLENEDDPDFDMAYSIILQALIQFYYEQNWADDLVDSIGSANEDGLFGGDESLILAFVDGLKDRTAELRYESIITGALVDSYTASWGETVEDQEVALRQLSEISDSTDNLERLSGKWSGTYQQGESDDADLILAFNRDVVGPYVNNGIRYLQAIEKIAENEKDTTDAVITGGKCAVAINWLMEESAKYDFCSQMVKDMKEEVGDNNLISALELLGTIRDLDDVALAQYMLLHQLMEQSDLFHDTLLRVAAQADVANRYTMQMMLESVAQQMDDVLYTDQLNYNLALETLDQFSEIADPLKVSNIAKSILGKKMKDSMEAVLLKKVAAAVGAGFFLVEQAFDLKDTCLMLSEMQYLRDVIEQTQQVYYSDVSVYKNNKTSENARKVMSDLMLLQRLRLRGENLARGLVGSQLNSPAGRLLSGSSFLDFLTGDETELSEGWNAHYQRSIDCLLGATLNPFGIEPIRVGPGEKLIIYYDSECETFRGGFSGSSVAGNVLFEMQYRVMPGIIVDGGELVLTDDISVPAVTVMNGSDLSIDPNDCKIGELTQSGGTLTVRNADLNCKICVDLSSVTVDLNGYRLITPDLTLWGTNRFSNGPVMTEDLHVYGAGVSGATIYCTGDVEASGTTDVEALILNGTEKQNVTGPLWVRNLTMDNSRTDGICSDGEIVVTGLLSDLTNDDPGGISLYETADISGSQVASDITLLGADISHAVHYLGNVTSTGDASTAGGHIEGFLLIPEGTFTNRSTTLTVEEPLRASGVSVVVAAPITVNSDACFSRTAFSGGSILSIRGDADFTSGNTSNPGTVIALYGDCTSDPNAGSNVLGTVRLTGTGAQDFGFTGTVSNLSVVNTSLLGVDVTGTTTITNSYTGRDQRVRNGEKLILTGDSYAEFENFHTALTIRDWHGSHIDGLVGTLYAQGDNRFTSDMAFGGGIRQTGGSVAIEDAVIIFQENLECAGSWTIDAYSSLVTSRDAGFSGKVVNDGLLKAEDVLLSGTMAGSGTLEVSGDLTAKAETDLAHLLLSGDSLQTISGELITADAVTAANTSLQGICFERPVYVTGSITAEDQRLRSGENLILTGTGSAFLENVTGNLRIEDWSGTTLTGLSGTLYASGDNVITSEVELGGGIRQESGTMTIDGGAISCRESMECAGTWTITGDGVLSSTGDGAFQGDIVNDGILKADSLQLDGTLSGSGTLEVDGDLLTKKAGTIGTLRFSGTGAQTVSGETVTADAVIAANTTLQGIRFESPVYVTGSFTAADQRLRSGENLILTGTGSAFLENVTGSLGIENWNGPTLSGLNGTLYANGDNVITSDLELRGGIRQESGTMTIDGAVVTCRETLECAGDWIITEDGMLSSTGDGVFLGDIVNDGILKSGDLQLRGTLSGTGTLEITGDLTADNVSTVGILQFSGTGAQTISGEITTIDLYNQNTSGMGVLLKSRVYITGRLENNGILRGVQPLQVTDAAIYAADTATAALSPAGDVVVCEGVTLTVNGDLDLSGQLVLESGAKLIVRGDLAGSGATVTIAGDADVTVRGNLRLSSTTTTLDGAMLVWNDTILSGGTVQGTGTLELRGDLSNSASVSGLDTLRLSGRVPQRVTGNDIHVAHAVAENTASGGLSMDLTVYYSETLTIEPGCNVSENYFEEE